MNPIQVAKSGICILDIFALEVEAVLFRHSCLVETLHLLTVKLSRDFDSCRILLSDTTNYCQVQDA